MIGLVLLFGIYYVMSSAQDYKAVDELNLPNYMGKWYQVYGDNFNKIFQGDGKCSTAQYALTDSGIVSVLNKQLDKDDHIDEITGSAYYKSGDCCGYLTVQLKDTPEAPYWVLELGPIVNNYYDYAIVSDDKALSLFVLARDVDNFYKYYDEQVLQSLNDFGFTKKYNMPKTMNQTDCLLN